MEQFAVIGLDAQEKKDEAEAILKELGYKGDKSWNAWNEERRNLDDFNIISAWGSGNYAYYTCLLPRETPITLDQLRAKASKTDPVEKPNYPCMMEVWDNGMKPKLRKVLAEFYTPKGVKRYVAISADGYISRVFDNARPIQPDPLKEVVKDMKEQLDKVDSVKHPDLKQWMGNFGVLLTPNEAQLIIDALSKNEK